jgi:hypothetical protein
MGKKKSKLGFKKVGPEKGSLDWHRRRIIDSFRNVLDKDTRDLATSDGLLNVLAEMRNVKQKRLSGEILGPESIIEQEEVRQ